MRVLVVDDSAYMRKMVSSMLQSDRGILVVGTARDGMEALEKVASLKPQVVTLDLDMPVLDGVGFLRAQLKREFLPVIVVSVASRHGKRSMEALDAGAFDFVRKPTALATERVLEISQDLISRVLAAGASRPGRLPAPCEPLPPTRRMQPALVDAVVLVISTGGPQALRYLIPRLPNDLPVPIAVVLHMPEGYTGLYAQRVDELAGLEVLEAEEGLAMQPGRVIIARAGRHLVLERKGDAVLARLRTEPKGTLHRPSGDILFRSAADVYGSRLLGVVMTGMGCDGTAGSAWIKARGGHILAEAESSSVVYGMPRSVFEAGLTDGVAPLGAMAEAILAAVGGYVGLDPTPR